MPNVKESGDMPLTMANTGEENTIKKISGKEETRKHLAALGFNIGETVVIVSESYGNVITKIKDSRVAISKEMANKILI